MNGLDFLSDSPKTYIFQKKSNKTNLGGILTIIYLIILASILFVYLFDYLSYEKYEYSYFYKYFIREDYIEKLKENPEFNPPTNFSFEIVDKYGESKPDNFSIDVYSISDSSFWKTLDMNEIMTKKVDEFLVLVSYYCPDYNCTFETNELKKLLTEEFTLIISYSSKIIDIDNPTSPLINTVLTETVSFYLDELTYIVSGWEITNYEEKKGTISRVKDYIFNKKSNFTFGKFENFISEKKRLTDSELVCNNEYCTRTLCLFRIVNELEGINLYKRKALSIWDYLANIASLGTTIFNGFSFIFGFLYSKNFDNYKIIDKILCNDIKLRKSMELNNIDNIEYKSNLENKLINKDNIGKTLSDNDIIINDIDSLDSIEENLNVDNKVSIRLPKLRFIDFLFNNIYSKCCIYIKRQKLIDSCNNILYKYFSIENILYNQILFENLMKDYQWNNSNLKTIQNNDLIINLKI